MNYLKTKYAKTDDGRKKTEIERNKLEKEKEATEIAAKQIHEERKYSGLSKNELDKIVKALENNINQMAQ
eukprot:Pgem_evm1s3207